MFKFLALASMVFLVVESASISAKNPWDKMEAENYSEAHGSRGATCCDGGYTTADNFPGNYLGYYGVDFGQGAALVTLRVLGIRNDSSVGYIHLRLGTTTTQPVVSVPVSSTGGPDPCNYILVTTFLPTPIVGVHDVYLTFDAPCGEEIVHVDWFRFTRSYV